jgi:serine/threonine-protein kinase RsbW
MEPKGPPSSPRDIRDRADPAEHERATSADPVADDAPFEIAFLRPEQAAELSWAIWRSYGRSYDADWVYRPEEIAERLRSGVFRSIVARATGEPDRPLVGHLGLTLHTPDAHAGEAGQAVVDPRWRGHHLFTTLKRHLADTLRAEGLAGMFSEATAAHPYSQKANVALGAQETGILVGYIPASVEYEAIDGAPTHRRSVVVYYLKLNDGPERSLYPPRHHRAIVAEIAQRAGLRGRVAESDEVPAGDRTRLSEQVRTDHDAGFVTVDVVGPDLARVVEAHLERERARGLACSYVDMPLDDPGTAAHGDALRRIDLRFGGVFPNVRRAGDVLRLQYLHDASVHADDVRLASEAGTRLLRYVLADAP